MIDDQAAGGVVLKLVQVLDELDVLEHAVGSAQPRPPHGAGWGGGASRRIVLYPLHREPSHACYL
jgi:hypothetical protein